MLPESLLREIWKDHEHFLVEKPRLADGSSVHVMDSGVENEHRGGPDFLKARLALDDVAVSGDVELHLTPKHWDDHKHDGDARYSNVVLHVVLEESEGEHGPRVPTFVLRDNLAFDRHDLWEALFRKLYDRSPALPCFPHNLLVPMRFKRNVIEKFGEARLDELIDRLTIWSDGFVDESRLIERVYQLTMDALGYSQNRVPFRELSAILPISTLQLVCRSFEEDTRLTFEALFFGMAGLLAMPSFQFDAETNEYLVELSARWNAIKIAIELPEKTSWAMLAESDWAFFRIRPANSPYRRLALAAVLAEKYFSRNAWGFGDSFFDKGPAVHLGESPFWESRTSFSAKLPEPQSLLGEERRSAIWLNVVLPARIARLRLHSNPGALHKAEKDLRSEWGGTHTKSSAKYLAAVEQELLESENVTSVRSEQGALILLRNFCEKGRCSECPIGSRLIEKGWKPKGMARTMRE